MGVFVYRRRPLPNYLRARLLRMSEATDGFALAMDGQGLSHGLVQAEFTQRKLEKLYLTVCRLLLGRGDWLMTLKHVLVWDKPMASVALYIAVHWLFV